MSKHFDLLNAGAVHLEGSLNAYARGNASYGDVQAESAAAQAHDGALEYLNALSVPFNDLSRHLHGVAGLDLREIALHLGVGQRADQIHD